MGLLNFIENYKKPTPVKWRKRGDFAILAAIIINLIRPLLGDNPELLEAFNELAPNLISALLMLFKLWTSGHAKEVTPNESK